MDQQQITVTQEQFNIAVNEIDKAKQEFFEEYEAKPLFTGTKLNTAIFTNDRDGYNLLTYKSENPDNKYYVEFYEKTDELKVSIKITISTIERRLAGQISLNLFILVSSKLGPDETFKFEVNNVFAGIKNILKCES